jgi:mannose-6-phosphate isomerase-like protein (cupin superfamily)
MFKVRVRKEFAILLFAGAAVSLATQAHEPHPTCSQCGATYVSKSEFDAYIKRSVENNIPDQEIRSEDIGKSNVGIGIVTLPRLQPGPKATGAAEHEQVTEVFYVIDGSGIISTGPGLVNTKERDRNSNTVHEQAGPGFSAEAITNPVTYDLKAGDILIIPAGTGHTFKQIDDHITFLVVRIDPDKVVALKNEAQSKAYLQSPAAKK